MSFEFTEEYKTYIKSPRWKAVCQRAYATYGKRCMACGSPRKLQVHHATYDRFGRELIADLRVVCDKCHRAIHAMHRANRKVSLMLVTQRYILAKRARG
ncbi:HNH endonuclease [Streptomyces phage Wakanda]|uniref:HNH endonuclease n=2 Tax=Wakandavirus TaxID=3044854 RepID=A0A6G8R3M1_9CAUD|nr:HNH endonuclease [Streptomyces phage Wakanda]YP_010652368.1 HNH endonuclease [Streptomyces phage Muntaha]QIN94224.1 HNH endonuclease [Streptomyces phage Wakanda]QIN94792.1 HNH endonuclease [Streptomyces phage Muntaha]